MKAGQTSTRINEGNRSRSTNTVTERRERWQEVKPEGPGGGHGDAKGAETGERLGVQTREVGN